MDLNLEQLTRWNPNCSGPRVLMTTKRIRYGETSLTHCRNPEDDDIFPS